jgi:Xaa-Pro aminopeptidase
VEQSRRRNAVVELVGNTSARRIGIEGAHTAVSDYRAMTEVLSGVELIALDAELDAIRDIKEPAELEQLEKVATLASQSLLAVLPGLRPGVVEADFALELEFEMRRRGADACGFDIIVASGERGAMPHGRASRKVVQAAELVTIDFGAVLDGYHSDETVTVAVGAIDDEQRRVYETVRVAHDLAIAAVKPGISCRDLDAVAREHIRKEGYGDFFGHGLGHGVGLEVHEKPVVSPRSEAMLEEGMVFTIEPGIYLPSRFGVRIEDTVAVTSDGCRVLTKVPKMLMNL